jgi:hypothetical protein
MAAETVGAWPPPPGVTPNFTNPDSIGYQLIVVNVLLPAITIPLCALRLYTKRYILKTVHLDDCMSLEASEFTVLMRLRRSNYHSNGMQLIVAGALC